MGQRQHLRFTESLPDELQGDEQASLRTHTAA
jgi:hypothetical protein